jgi:hypothetical protein
MCDACTTAKSRNLYVGGESRQSICMSVFVSTGMVVYEVGEWRMHAAYFSFPYSI